MIREKIFQIIENQRSQMVDTIMDLIRIPSMTGQETPAQKFMESLYAQLDGIKPVRVYPDIEKVKQHDAFIETDISYDDRFNLVAVLEGDPAKKSIILNGHVDIVSPEPIQAWKTDPFVPSLTANRLYGRGAGDMKSGLIANFFALKAILDAGLPPGGTVQLQSVIDEEAGGAGGTLFLMSSGYSADGFLVTEPHNLQITVSHAGILYFKIRVLGKTAHGGLAHQGVNAIGKMIPIYLALEKLEQERAVKKRFPLYQKGSGQSCHLAVSKMIAGDWPGKVAGKAELSCRISFIPGETKTGIQALITELVRDVAKKDSWLREHPPEIVWCGWQNEPWFQDPEHPFISQLKAAGQMVLKAPPEIIGRASGNDARFSQYFSMPGGCIGPIAHNIHGPNEWVDMDSVEKLVKILALFILDWTQ